MCEKFSHILIEKA